MAHRPRGGSRIFTRRRLRSRLVPRAKITGARMGGGGGGRSAKPRMRRRRLKLTPRAVWTLLGMGTVVFLVVLLALLLNSPPVKRLWPADGSCVSGSPVRMEASLRGGVGLEQLTVLLDGQDVTGQAVMEGSLLHLEVPLPDGEHSLEVQVPFLQRLLGEDLRICPVVVGVSRAGQIAELMAAALPDALVVVSTDLSHYHDDATAKRLDRRTAETVLARDAEGIGLEDACGVFALRGIVELARREDLRVHLLDLRTSADTAGDPWRVVGYGAFALTRA